MPRLHACCPALALTPGMGRIEHANPLGGCYGCSNSTTDRGRLLYGSDKVGSDKVGSIKASTASTVISLIEPIGWIIPSFVWIGSACESAKLIRTRAN